MIRIENLHYRYPPFDPNDPIEDVPYALNGLDLEIDTGEFVGIIGTTGSGKSTLCLTLNGLVPQQTSGSIRGDVWIDEWNTKRTSVVQLATKVGLVFQDPEANFLGLSVEDEIAFGQENLGIAPNDIERRIDETLAFVGMSGLRHRSVASLSGGQKQRVAIAAVIAMQPQILVLDEPTAELDPIGKRQVSEVIANLLRQQPEMTVVMVSADPEPLAEFASRIIVLDQGKIILDDMPGTVFADVQDLTRRGIPVPEVSELAARINVRYQRDYRFASFADARDALRQELGFRT